LSAPGNFVRLLDVDPDLGLGLSPQRLPDLAEESWTGTWTLCPGAWKDADLVDPGVALYVITGSLARRVIVGGRSSIELLGPGQVLRPRFVGSADETVAAATTWHVLSAAWIAVLDQTFFRRVAAYPELVLALLDRVMLRARSLAVRLAAVGVPNLEERLLIVLWHLADAYGRVSKQGVIIDLALSHDVLAQLVSAQRSSVSRAIKRLERASLVSRGPERGFVLHGAFASSYALLRPGS
jgi:CRP-like cAMP-binding protein